MKAALLLAPERIAIESVADQPPAPGEVVIQPAIAGICGTDISFFTGHRSVPYPFVLGHEVTGRIIALGAGVTKFRVGQRVVVEPNYPCGACALCNTGRGAVCAQKLSMGVNVPGCFSERAVAPAEFVWALPDRISDPDAATIEPLAVSIHGLRQSGAKAGDTVAVLGCGVVGLLLIHAAVAEGVRVIAHDRLTEKQAMAAALGAVVVPESENIETLWQMENVSVVFECAGVTPTVELALKSAPRGAKVVLLGISALPASFVPMKLVREGINVLTSMIYDHPSDFAHVIDRVAQGLLHPSKVVTHSFPFEGIREALVLAGAGGAGKIHIRMA
jgi:2-desacetyl-2-hydroxyethyl bacteriochlorophyllide A dehydrogenase